MKKEVIYLFGTDWIQRFAEYPIYKCKMISAFIIYETAVIEIGCIQHFWL
jgi:hypothetical protein